MFEENVRVVVHQLKRNRSWMMQKDNDPKQSKSTMLMRDQKQHWKHVVITITTLLQEELVHRKQENNPLAS